MYINRHSKALIEATRQNEVCGLFSLLVVLIMLSYIYYIVRDGELYGKRVNCIVKKGMRLHFLFSR